MDTVSDVLYEVSVTSAKDSARADDGNLDLPIKAPKELGGPGGTANPESLFAASFATCLHAALALVASGQGVDTEDSQVRATARIGRDEQGYVWAVDVEVSLPGAPEDARARIVDQAAHICPIVRCTAGTLEVSITAR